MLFCDNPRLRACRFLGRRYEGMCLVVLCMGVITCFAKKAPSNRQNAEIPASHNLLKLAQMQRISDLLLHPHLLLCQKCLFPSVCSCKSRLSMPPNLDYSINATKTAPRQPSILLFLSSFSCTSTSFYTSLPLSPFPYPIISILLNNDQMSNILRSMNGNLSKVKYFLPAYRNQEQSSIHPSKPKQSRSTNKKHSSISHPHNQSVTSNGDISFQIVGVHENSHVSSENHDFTRSNNSGRDKENKMHLQQGLEKLKNKNGEKAIQASLSSIRALTNSREWSLPQGSEKQQFYRFIQTLKDDETYQHTITMFTIMYFYQKKKTSIR